MLIPLNNTIPDIAIINKEVKTNDFCESLLLFAINIQTSLNIINKPTTSFSSLKVEITRVDNSQLRVFLERLSYTYTR